LSSYNIISVPPASQPQNLAYSFNGYDGESTKYKGAYTGSYLIKHVPQSHAIGFKLTPELKTSINVTGDHFSSSVAISGSVVDFYYGNVYIEITKDLPMTVIPFGFASNINSFNQNKLLVNDYCQLDREVRYYYSNTPIPNDCSECNTSMLEPLHKIQY
jgi:hypothetical protein